MNYDPDNPTKNIGSTNDKMKVGSGAPKTPDAPKKPGDNKQKKRKGFMSGSYDDKKGDMESVAGGLKGAQMLIKTLFPSDEPIPRR